MSVLGAVHGRFVAPRRVRVLCGHLDPLLPHGARVLDVGAGDAILAGTLLERRPDLRIEGIDVLVRPDAAIPVTRFDGLTIPFADGAFDAVLIVDVLHHAVDPVGLLKETVRVSRTAVVIKDHLLDGWLARLTLRAMDWVGNARHGVALPYNYLPLRAWNAAFDSARLDIVHWRTRLRLYPPPASFVFDRSLHFVAQLRPRALSP